MIIVMGAITNLGFWEVYFIVVASGKMEAIECLNPVGEVLRSTPHL